jgi:hypothetical protein
MGGEELKELKNLYFLCFFTNFLKNFLIRNINLFGVLKFNLFKKESK